MWVILDNKKEEALFGIASVSSRVNRLDGIGLFIFLQSVPNDIQRLSTIDDIVETGQGKADPMVRHSSLNS
jgi:hypothetical protein